MSLPTAERAGETWDLTGEQPGPGVFLRNGDTIFHAYSTHERGLDMLLGTCHYLDVRPLGRQDDGPGSYEFHHHDRYGTTEAEHS